MIKKKILIGLVAITAIAGIAFYYINRPNDNLTDIGGITTMLSTDTLKDSRSVINNNFAYLENNKLDNADMSGDEGITYTATGTIGFDCSEVEGTGIDCSGEDITLDATGDWTGTLDGYEASALLDGGSTDYLGSIGDVSTTTLSAGYVLKYSGSAWESVATSTLGITGGTGSQTPWTSNIDGGGYDLTNVSNASLGTTTLTGSLTASGLIKSTGYIAPDSGTGIYMFYIIGGGGADTGEIMAYDYGASDFKTLALSGQNITFSTESLGQMALSATGGLSLGNSYVNTDAGGGSMILSGKLGIGTSTFDTYELDVKGDSRISGQTTLSYASTTVLSASGIIYANGGNSANWNTAYGWGDWHTPIFLTQALASSSYATSTHTHNYDNYASWTIQDGDTTTYTVTSGDTLQIADGAGIDSNFSGDDVLTITHSTANGYVHIPSDGSSAQLLQYTSAGTAKWITASGDITIADGGALSIGDNKVVEADLKAVNSASDEECLTYETTTGDFEWQECGTGSSATTTWQFATSTATAGQTIFNTGFTYNTGENQLEVYVNGVRQTQNDDYTESSSTAITFLSGRLVGDKVSMQVSGGATAGGGSGTVTSVAMTLPTGLEVSGSPITDDGTLAVTLTSGYIIPLSASTTEWNAFYTTPSGRITAGDGIDWSTNTLNVDNVSAAMLASADFGNFTCNGTSCSLDTDAIDAITEIAAALKDGSGDCGTGLICLGDHTHSAYATLASPTFTGVVTIANASTTVLTVTTGYLGTLLGTIDAGGATSFEIPNGTAPVFSATGQIGWDTSDNQLLIATTTANTPLVIPTMQKLWGGTIASTSQDFISGGRIWLPPQRDGFRIKEIHCAVDGGTSVVIGVSNSGGTTDSETVTCDADGQTDVSVDTNPTYAAGSLNSLEIGTITGAVDYVTFSVWGIITRE